MADDRFYVKTLTLENFRCFEKAELGPFDPHFNLIVGENGAGKSSILNALANLFHPIATGSETPPASLALSEADVKFGQNMRGEVVRSSNPAIVVSEFNKFGIACRASIEVDTLNDGSVQFHGKEIKKSVSSKSFGVSRAGAGYILSVIAFYGANRKFAEPERNYKPNSTLNRVAPTRNDELNKDWQSAGLSSDAIREWFKDQTLLALQLEERVRERKLSDDFELNIHPLGLVQSAITTALGGVRKIWYDGLARDITVEIDTGKILPFRTLSDGQRVLIGLVSDIARRAWMNNGSRLGPETLRRTPGLVLIDEIDLHLHPTWQRQIVPALKKIFPKIQFFATTHSPQVIGECKPEEIVLLTPQGQKRPSGSFGRDSNWILECVMDAEGRDPEIAKRLKKLFDAIEDGHFASARTLLRKLRKDIGDGPDIVGAESYLWRMEHLGDEAAE